MNIYTKLRDLGWKKSQPVKLDYDYKLGYEMVVPDIPEELKNKPKKTPNRYEKYLYNKIGVVEIWIKIIKDDISFLIIGNKKDVVQINIHHKISSKNDIINLLPKELRRNLLINDLFK